MTDEQQPDPESTPEMQRLQAACDALNELNRMLPPGVAGFSVAPEQIEMASKIDAVINIGLQDGTITEERFEAERTLAAARIMEGVVEQVTELKAAASKPRIVVPGAPQPV